MQSKILGGFSPFGSAYLLWRSTYCWHTTIYRGTFFRWFTPGQWRAFFLGPLNVYGGLYISGTLGISGLLQGDGTLGISGFLLGEGTLRISGVLAGVDMLRLRVPFQVRMHSNKMDY